MDSFDDNFRSKIVQMDVTYKTVLQPGGRTQICFCTKCRRFIHSCTHGKISGHPSTCGRPQCGIAPPRGMFDTSLEVPSLITNDVIKDMVMAGINPHQGFQLFATLHAHVSVPISSQSDFYVKWWEWIDGYTAYHLEQLKEHAVRARGCAIVTVDAGTSTVLGLHIICMKLVTAVGQRCMPLYVAPTKGAPLNAGVLLFGMKRILGKIGISFSDVVKVMADNDAKNLLALAAAEDAAKLTDLDESELQVKGFVKILRDDISIVHFNAYDYAQVASDLPQEIARANVEGTAVALLGEKHLHQACLAHIVKNTIHTAVKNTSLEGILACRNAATWWQHMFFGVHGSLKASRFEVFMHSQNSAPSSMDVVKLQLRSHSVSVDTKMSIVQKLFGVLPPRDNLDEYVEKALILAEAPRHSRPVTGASTRYDRSYHGTFQQLYFERETILKFLASENKGKTDLSMSSMKLMNNFPSNVALEMYLEAVNPLMSFLREFGDASAHRSCAVDVAAAMENVMSNLKALREKNTFAVEVADDERRYAKYAPFWEAVRWFNPILHLTPEEGRPPTADGMSAALGARVPDDEWKEFWRRVQCTTTRRVCVH
eukprot:PhM_4_TR11647/c4_g3_i1/m.68147